MARRVPPGISIMSALLLTTLVAGCLGDQEPSVDTAPRVAEEARVTDRTGSIVGQILTIDLEVIVEGSVRLLNETDTVASTETDNQGRFTINDVPAGRYRLEISAACCAFTTEGVEVLNGQVSEVGIRLERLNPRGLDGPYMIQDEWEGFLACGISVASQPNDQCAAGDGNHDDAKLFDIASGIEELVVALNWEPSTQSLAPDLRLLVENRNCCYERYAYMNGPPPLIAFINDDHVERNDGYFQNITAFMDMHYEVTAGGNNLVYQQPFTIYWYEFYNQRAPEGFEPLPDV